MSEWGGKNAVGPSCAGLTRLFFAYDAAEQDEARRICRRCPFQLPCLLTAVGRRERHGTWGGVCFEDVGKSTQARRSIEHAVGVELARLEPATA